MKIKLSFLIKYIVVIFLLSVSSADAKIFVPETGKTVIIIGQDEKNIKEYINKVDTPAGFMFYTSVQRMDGLFNRAQDNGAGFQHAQPLIDKYPDAIIQIGLYMVNALDDVVAGNYESNIDKLADWIKQTERPVYLRVGYEFDLPENNYDPEKYVAAYQYVVDRIRAKNVENVNFVWHSYGYINPGNLPTVWYPGDAYVDWVGVSFFNAFNKWNTEYLLTFSKNQGKAFMLAEATPYRIGVKDGEDSWRKWYKPFFKFIEEHDVPFVSYINCDWQQFVQFKNDFWGDSRVQENKKVKKLWQRTLKGERYLKASNKLFTELKYERNY
ncbi:MAG: hypothetical protein ACI9E5_000839 [Candidatus Omnitrophota bacterium]|jgi:hypothetical protein